MFVFASCTGMYGIRKRQLNERRCFDLFAVVSAIRWIHLSCCTSTTSTLVISCGEEWCADSGVCPAYVFPVRPLMILFTFISPLHSFNVYSFAKNYDCCVVFQAL